MTKKNGSQIKRRAKVILKLNSNKVSELHWSAEYKHTHYPFILLTLNTRS